MNEKHEHTLELLEQTLRLLDRVADVTSEAKIEPTNPILKNVGMAIAHILQAKKQISDHANGSENVSST